MPRTSDSGHGLRDVLVANNTFIQSAKPLPASSEAYVWQMQPLPGKSSNSFIENNIIVTVDTDDFFMKTESANADTGIANDYNLYTGPGHWGAPGGNSQTFAQWQSAHPQWDRNSVTGDSGIAGLDEFNQTAEQRPVYDWAMAKAAASSTAFKMGTDMSAHFTTDFTGAPRSSASLGAFASH